MYIESYKNLINKIKEELNKSKGTPCSQIGRLNMVKMPVHPNLIHLDHLNHTLIQCDPNQHPGKWFMGPTNWFKIYYREAEDPE